MPIRQGGMLARRASIWPRDHFCSTIARPSSTTARGNCEWSSCYSATRGSISTVRYLGVEVDDALEIAEKIDV
jgi:hypothetical protein